MRISFYYLETMHKHLKNRCVYLLDDCSLEMTIYDEERLLTGVDFYIKIVERHN